MLVRTEGTAAAVAELVDTDLVRGLGQQLQTHTTGCGQGRGQQQKPSFINRRVRERGCVDLVPKNA